MFVPYTSAVLTQAVKCSKPSGSIVRYSPYIQGKLMGRTTKQFPILYTQSFYTQGKQNTVS